MVNDEGGILDGFSGGVGTKEGISGEDVVSVTESLVPAADCDEERSGEDVTLAGGGGVDENLLLFSLSMSSSTLRSKRLPILFRFGGSGTFFGFSDGGDCRRCSADTIVFLGEPSSLVVTAAPELPVAGGFFTTTAAEVEEVPFTAPPSEQTKEVSNDVLVLGYTVVFEGAVF